LQTRRAAEDNPDVQAEIDHALESARENAR
jgi:hypothetical protein